MLAPIAVGILSATTAFVLPLIKIRTRVLFLAFVPLFCFLAFRKNYGNDYAPYLALFNEIASLSEMIYDSFYWHTEVGWLILNRVYSNVGFYPMVATLAAFNCYVYARFINKFVPLHYYWLSVLIYIFGPDNMLTQSSAMRQAVAISLFILAIEFAVSKKFIYYALMIFLGSCFHTSMILCAPAYFIAANNFSIRKTYILLLIAVYVVLFFVSDSLAASLVNILIGGDAESALARYLVYEDKGEIGTGLGLVFQAFYLFLLLYYHDRQVIPNRVILRLVIIGIYIIPFSSSIMLISRVGFYFSIFSVAAIPLIAVSIKNSVLRLGFICLFFAYYLYTFIQFFNSPVWRDSFSNYTTIFH